jgi:NADPH-dependent curcumin reductase CurA
VNGPNDMMRLVYRQVKMQGFSGMAWPHEIPEAIADIKRWVEGRRIVHREDVRHGFENVPKDFLSLFDGSNHGTLMTKL